MNCGSVGRHATPSLTASAILQQIEVLLQDPDPCLATWASRLKRSMEEMLEKQRLQEEADEL
jgi:hypothetical protein